MDLVKYEAFLNVVERGSYSKACEDLGYTLSGISKMMKSMEEEIGIPLIIRTNKGISLTPEGERITPMIRQMIQDKAIVEEELALMKGVESGKIRIGCFPTISFAWVPSIIAHFKQAHPNIQIEITEENGIKNLEQWLNQGIIDVGIFSRQPYHNYDWTGLRTDRYVALFRPDHRFAEYEQVPVNELFREELVLFKSHEGIDQDIVKVMEHVTEPRKSRYTTNSDFTAVRLAEQLGCVTLLPQLIAEKAVQNFAVDYKPIDAAVTREIGFAVRDARRVSPAVKKLLKFVKETEF